MQGVGKACPFLDRVGVLAPWIVTVSFMSSCEEAQVCINFLNQNKCMLISIQQSGEAKLSLLYCLSLQQWKGPDLSIAVKSKVRFY